MPKILDREPPRSSQTCGYQITVGDWSNGPSKFCGEPKVRGLYYCQAHHDWQALDGPIRMAPGNAIGR
jgi:hypothetical protein